MIVRAKTYGLRLVFLGLLLFFTTTTIAQGTKQKQLEQRRLELRKELAELDKLRKQTKAEETSILQQAEDLNQQIQTRQQLISVTNRQANALSREIDENLVKIKNLRDELETLKKDYADMVEKSYKSKSQQSRVMFLLSSESFKQAYKRVQYMKQYANYRKRQGEQVKERTIQLQNLNKTLLKQRSDKERLIAENKEAQEQLNQEKEQQKVLIATIRSKANTYAAQIKKKQQEADKIDKEIDRLIKEAIAARNAKRKKDNKKVATPSKKGNLALTPEEELIAASFAGNKGRHIWPVERGRVVKRFGRSKHPTLPNVTTYSSGVEIQTTENAEARAIYEGEVLSIQEIRGANKAVYILHGDYITIYRNIKNLKVQKREKVTRKQVLGTVATNAFTGKSIIKFYIRRNDDKLNPASWILNM